MAAGHADPASVAGCAGQAALPCRPRLCAGAAVHKTSRLLQCARRQPPLRLLALLAARSLAATVRSLAALAPRLPAATVPRVVGRGEREERFGAWGLRWRGEGMGP